MINLENNKSIEITSIFFLDKEDKIYNNIQLLLIIINFKGKNEL